MILLVYHVTSTSNTSFFFFFVFYIALSVSTNRSNLSLLICTRFPFHNRYSALGFSLTNLRSFPSPIRKYAAASSIDNVYFFQYGKCKKFYFFVFVSHIYKRRTVFLQGVGEIFLFLRKKNSYKTPFFEIL